MIKTLSTYKKCTSKDISSFRLNIKPFFLTLIIASSILATQVEATVVVGSDLLKDIIEPTLKNYSEGHGLELTLEMNGSTLSMGKIRNQEADLAFLANPDEKPFDIEGYQSIPFAYFASVVIVNKNNPLTDISAKQLAGIFGDNIKPKISRWSDLNLAGTWRTRNIRPISISHKISIGFELIKYKVMPDGAIDTNVMNLDDPLAIIDRIRTNRDCIAIAPMIKSDYNVKILPISGKTSDGSEYTYKPSPENIYYGDYPFRLKFIILLKKESKYQHLQLLKTLLSDDFSRNLQDNYLIPLPKRDRKRITLELDIN